MISSTFFVTYIPILSGKASEFTPSFSGFPVAHYLVFCVVFCR